MFKDLVFRYTFTALLISGLVPPHLSSSILANEESGSTWKYTPKYVSFTATNPTPVHNLTSVQQTMRELSWIPSNFSVSQVIWLGTKRSDVGNGRPSTFLARLDGNVGRFKLPDTLKLAAGQEYFWRVSTDNGSLGADSGIVWRFRIEDVQEENDITFFVTSDTHYGNADNNFLNKQTIDLMNSAAGLPLPQSFGSGYVKTPRGVILNGDLLDNGSGKAAAENWAEFVRDYGLTGRDGRLAFPVYEGFGNHDGGPGKSYNRTAIRERNKNRPGVTSVSDNGLHYSWDWDNLHLVQLNLFGGNGPQDVMNVSGPSHDPEAALEFLKQDLKKNVGKKEKKVIIFQHFSWVGGMSDWWTPEAKERFYDVVKNYPVIALVNGHSHGASFVPWKDILTIHDGSSARPEGGTGDFLIFRIVNNELSVIQRKTDGWGVMMRQPIKAIKDKISDKKTR